MGIEERREREKHGLKQGILRAALHIAAEEGWQKVTIRKIADQIEYSPPTIYEYFENKEAILSELRRDGYRQMLTALQLAYAEAKQQSPSNPQEAILRLARTYWDFAQKQPQLYQVMHGIGVGCQEDDETAEEADILALSLQAVRQLLPQADETVLEDAVETVALLLHGFVATELTGHIEGGQARAVALLEQALRDLMIAWVIRSQL